MRPSLPVRRARGLPLSLLSLGLCLAPTLAQGPIPTWLNAPGSAANFNPATTQYDGVNAFLAMSHAVMAGPTDIGFPNFDDSAAMRAAYEARIRSILLGSSTAFYGTGSTLRVASGWGFDQVTFFRSAITDTEGYIASNASYTMIVFRGSELSDLRSMAQDWAQTDFNVAPVALIQGLQLPTGMVHAGFLTAIASVHEQIMQQLRDVHGYRPRFVFLNGRIVALQPTKPIWTTGYSLGGADATMAAFLLSQQDGLPVKGTITGGAPSIGSSGFGSMFLNAGLQIYRHQNNLEVPPMAFGELNRLPGDLTGTLQNVANWVVGHFDEPLRTPMQGLVSLLLAPANVVVDGVTVAGDLASMNNVGYAHFGSLRYFDRNATLFVNPSTAARQGDRVATLSNGVIAVLRQFEPPSPPSSPFDLAGWSRYFSQIGALADRIASAVTHPGAVVSQLGSTFEQYITDHSTVKLTRLLHDVLPASMRDIASMPKRP